MNTWVTEFDKNWNVNSNSTIADVHSGLCLDVNGAATANGTSVITWSCNGGSSQQWTGLKPPDPGTGPLPSR